MGNIKNKQHYVFQAYLKNWCNEDDKLWVCNKKERKFLELLMEYLRVDKTTKVEMRRHIELYLTPYKFKHMVDMAKMINPVPVNPLLKQELQLDFDNLYKILEESIVNTGEDVYSDFEASGMECIRRIMEGDLQFYYPSIDNCNDVAFQDGVIYEKIDEFIVHSIFSYC